MADEFRRRVRTAGDGQQMRTLFADRLGELLESPPDVLRCDVTTVHVGEGSANIHYGVRLRWPDEGREQDVALTGIFHAAEPARSVARAMTRATPIPVAAGVEPLPAFWAAPSLDMLVQVFPYDVRMPRLAEVMLDPGGVLADVAPGRASDRPGLWQADVVQYRPGRRATVRLTGPPAAVGESSTVRTCLFAKVFNDPAVGARSYGVLQDIAAAGRGRFVVGSPVGRQDDGRLLIHEEVPGPSLLDILRKGDDNAARAVRASARAIAALHLLPIEAVVQSPERDPVASIGESCAALRRGFPDLAESIDECGRRVAEVGGVSLVRVPIHGDLKPEHIRLDGDRVGFIDFDRFARADPMQDLAYLLFRVARGGGRSSRRRPEAMPLVTAFLDEYFAAAPAAWRTRLPAQYAAIALAKAATFAGRGASRDVRPDRIGKVSDLIDEAREAIAGAVV